MSDAPRHLALVVGPGRSGTSLLAGICTQLGFSVPQPEVQANKTNPKGFGEPRWVVDFHAALMNRAKVSLFDARPAAWDDCVRVSSKPARQTVLREWLEGEFAGSDRVVVKDPRTGWFLDMWQAAAEATNVSPHFLTTLRHPSQVLVSVRTTAGNRQPEASRAAWWISFALRSERLTRSGRRAFVVYDDLLADWRKELGGLEERSGLPLLNVASPEQIAAVDSFVDPDLRRSAYGWDRVDVPTRVSDLAEESWRALTALARQPERDAETRATLDSLLEEYDRLYGEAEAIAFESSRAAAATAVAKARAKDRRGGPPASKEQAGAKGSGLRSVVGRLTGRS